MLQADIGVAVFYIVVISITLISISTAQTESKPDASI